VLRTVSTRRTEQAAAPGRVLVVDDDEALVRSVRILLTRAGFTVTGVTDAVEGLGRARSGDSDVVLLDVRMPHLGGMELLRELRAGDGAWGGEAGGGAAGPEVMLMTAHASVEEAVEALHAGAADYLVKPFAHPEEVVVRVQRAVERRMLRERAARLERELEGRAAFEELVGQSAGMQRVFRLVESVAASDTTILVQGESGTGKELVARAIHQRSARRAGPFIAVNCSALTEGLLDSELFGHVKGAFTGALKDRKGVFEEAHGGTLFLDEIGDISPATQVRLLRVLQEGKVRRVGDAQELPVDVRVVTATHRDLARAREEGTFREDLFYRLNVIPVHLPSLRERAEDIPLLAHHFLRRSAERAGKPVRRLTADALAALQAWRWPGNVRELQNAIERAVVLAQGEELAREDLPPDVARGPQRGGPGGAGNGNGAGEEPSPGALVHLPYAQAKDLTVSAFERRYLRGLLARHGHNIAHAARAAGMDRSNFRRLMRQAGVEAGDSDEG
jgi:two-component system response regulator HydG